VRPLYLFIRQTVQSFSTPGRKGLLEVVLVRFPSQEMISIGFITKETSDKAGKKLLSVLIPMAPNPVSGFLIVVPEEEIVRTDIRADDAIKVIVSAGTQLPGDIVDRISLVNPSAAPDGKGSA
jgi:uncharacterized membrane protein